MSAPRRLREDARVRFLLAWWRVRYLVHKRSHRRRSKLGPFCGKCGGSLR